MKFRPRIIAHRGASGRWPENTVAAFAGAIELNADWVELDVRPAGGGALVVSHDPGLPDGRLLVETDRADLPPEIPSLADALAACGDLGVNVEIKNDPAEPGFDDGTGPFVADVLTVMEQHLDPGRALVTSFHRPTLDLLCRIGGGWPAGLLFYLPQPERNLAALAEQGFRAINPHHALVDAELVVAAHRHGLEINVWTVDDPQRIAELARLGVDGIITNVPDIARAAPA